MAYFHEALFPRSHCMFVRDSRSVLPDVSIKINAEILMAWLPHRLEEHGDLAGPEGLLQFDERLYKAARGLLQEGAWAELLKSGGSAPALLSLPSSFPPLAVSPHLPIRPRLWPRMSASVGSPTMIIRLMQVGLTSLTLK